MLSFIDDLTGAVYDAARMLLKGFGYFAAGVVIVSTPLYLLTFSFEWIAKIMIVWEFYR